MEWLSLEQAVRLGREMGITEAQASRGAFRMIANNPELTRAVYGLLTTLLTKRRLDLRLRAAYHGTRSARRNGNCD